MDSSSSTIQEKLITSRGSYIMLPLQNLWLRILLFVPVSHINLFLNAMPIC